MKKTLLIGLALIAGLGLSAQQSVLKEVERSLKSSASATQALNDIQPALTNPETAELAETWTLAGRAGFDVYQESILLQATGQQLSPEQQDAAAGALLDGFGYYLHALPLDTVVDAKGKTKTKYSKDIVKHINQKYEDLRNAGVMAWQNADYDRAYNIWELYLTLPTNPVLGKNAPKAAVDTIQGEIMWNQAIARLLTNDNAGALAKFQQMEGYNFMPEDYYAYAMTAAQAVGNDELANEYARKGLENAKTNESKTGFIAQLINTELNNKNYTAANKLVNDALETTPESEVDLRAQLYDILGSIAENAENLDEAAGYFKKAIETNPNYGKGYFDYGRILYNRALALDDTLDSEADRDARAVPMFKEAAGYFEKAYELDDNLSQVPGALYRLYYRLGPGYEDKASYWENL
ncbi:MAG: hypothetical protein NC336_05160 [Clostridium sp.]|nr:hypothetical protein [Clostridium sp.]